MARPCLFTWKLSVFVYSKAARNGPLSIKYGKISNQLFKVRQFASLSKKSLYLAASKVESESDSDSESQHANDLVDLKLKILKAGLNFVSEHGWTKQSIGLGANSLGLSTASHNLIQDGGADLVHYFNFLCNDELETYLKEQGSSNQVKNDMQNYIVDALEHRLKMVIPYVTKWPEALALMVPPNQFTVDCKNLLDLVDIIWYHSGDQSSLSLTWYSKRFSLAMAYRMCELSLVKDKSPDFSDTFGFLQRRVENVLDTNKFINEVADSSKHFPEITSGALITDFWMEVYLNLNVERGYENAKYETFLEQIGGSDNKNISVVPCCASGKIINHIKIFIPCLCCVYFNHLVYVNCEKHPGNKKNLHFLYPERVFVM